MSRLLRWTILPLCAFLIVPAFADDKKKDDPNPPKVPEKKDDPKPPKVPEKNAPKVPKVTGKKEAENKLIKAGEIAGEVTHVEPTKNTIRVKVTISYGELNQGAYRNLIQAQIDLQKAAANRDANGVVAARNAIIQNQRSLVTVKSVSKEVPVDAADDCKVRLAQPKAAFDDMGNVKKYTAKELAALRGKDRLFDGEFSDLAVGQIVKVTLVKPKGTPAPRGKDAGLDDYKLQASRIVVITQPVAKP